MIRQNNISRFQTYLLISFAYWLATKEFKAIDNSSEIGITIMMELYKANIATESVLDNFFELKFESGETFKTDIN